MPDNSSSPRSAATRAAATLASIVLMSCSAPAPEDAPPSLAAPGPMVALPSPTGPGAGEANLFATGDGRVHLSWLEPASDEDWALRFATLTGREWTEVRTIASESTFFVNWADFPSLIELGAGQLVAHWLQRSGPGTYAYDVMLGRSSDSGATWSAPFRPHEDGTETEHGFVSLVPERDGGFTAVWLDGRKSADRPEGAGAEMTLRSRRYDSGGKGGPEALLDGRVCDCCQTSAAHVGDRLLVAYRDRSDQEIRDIHVVSRGPEGWSEPVPVGSDGWMIPGCPVNGPSLAARGELAAVAWFGLVDQTPEVKVAFTKDAGASFGPPVLIERGTVTEATLGRVALLWVDDRRVLVTWLTGVGEQGQIRARFLNVDGVAGPVQNLATTSPARSSGFPRLALNGDRVVVAWRVPDDPGAVRLGSIRVR